MIIGIICIAIIILVILVVKKYNERQRILEENNRAEKIREVNQSIKIEPKKKKEYTKKKLMTDTEIRFFHSIKNCTPKGYIVLPQINLATIINRTDEHKYQNELYRNIDFAIFDLETKPIVLIEINDKTHKEKERWIRDKKVEAICNEAELPIITLWTDFGINEEYIKSRIEKYCKISA